MIHSARGKFLRRGCAWIALAMLTAACSKTPHLADGRWIGDLRHGDGADHIELSSEQEGRVVRLTIPAWGMDGAAAATVKAEGASLSFTFKPGGSGPGGGGPGGGGDEVVVSGTLRDGAFTGAAKKGTEARPFNLRLLHPMTEAEWRGVVGTYRTATGGLVGIAPFGEFGPTPLVVDYTSGRLAPIHPIAHGRFLVGRTVMAPLWPPDALVLTYSAGSEAQSLRLEVLDAPAVKAERLDTGDQEVQFANGDVTLHGTLTMPAGEAPHPAIVLVHGSGPETRDFLGPWVRFFAGEGYAVLSYDKRGTGQSQGEWMKSDFDDLAGDVLSGVRLLAARPEIKPDRIGLFGISQGGWVAPLAASKAPDAIAFLVIHGGSGTTVREEGILYIQHELRFAGLPEPSVMIGTRYQALDDAVTRGERGWDELQGFYEANRKEESWLWPPRPADDPFRPFYRRLMDFDPAPAWEKVKCPVLLFFGERDANVPPVECWPPIERALKRGGNADVTHFILPGANHLLLEAKTGTRDEYPGLSRFVAGYFDTMSRWLREHGRG